MATRRVVTGHEAQGRSVVASDAPVPHVRVLPGAKFDEVWTTGDATPSLAPMPEDEPTSPAASIGPSGEGGSVLRVIEFAPSSAGGRISPMHRTRTVDYGIVLEGEMVLILSDSEVVLRAGDVVIQRATDHAWENRSGQPAKMAFILIGAQIDPELAGLIGEQEWMP